MQMVIEYSFDNSDLKLTITYILVHTYKEWEAPLLGSVICRRDHPAVQQSSVSFVGNKFSHFNYCIRATNILLDKPISSIGHNGKGKYNE